MPEKYLVIANGDPPSYPLFKNLLEKHTRLVAVDGGFLTCLRYGVGPHMMIGDFDSVSPEMLKEHNSIPQIYTPDQNKSDLEKALDYLFSLSSEEITVCGALGKRVDHALTNICLLSRYPGKVKFETDTERCFALLKSTTLNCKPGQILSLIPLGTPVTGVTTQGLQWELKDALLDKFFFSISNVCLSTEVSIAFESGDLIACQGI